MVSDSTPNEDPRVMVVGSRTGGGVEDHSADWNEEKKIGDYDIVIFDLHELEQSAAEFDHPHFETENAVEFPSGHTIRKHLEAGNDIVVRLPTSQKAVAYDEDHGPLHYDLMRWLPFRVSLADESGEKVVKPDECNRAHRQEWRLFFEGLEKDGFAPISGWENAVDSITPVYGDQRDYPDPTPPESDEDGVVRKTLVDSAPDPGDKRDLSVDPLLTDNLERPVAAAVSVIYHDKHGEQRAITLPSEGDVILLPPITNHSHSEFVERYLWAKHRIVTGPTLPSWLPDYPLIGEEQLKARADDLVEEIEEFEEEVYAARHARDQLLSGQGDDLERAVRAAFEEIGFDVDGEVSGGRDGAVHTENRIFVLEVTGQKGGVKQSKIDRLERHIEDAKEDYTGDDLVGLLVYNHRRERPPQERQLNTSNFRDDLIQKEQKLLTTVDLYHLLNRCSRGEVDREAVEARLENDGPIISVDRQSDGSGQLTIEEILETIEDGKEWIVNSLRRY